jgi:indolepyruvate ferredoxin oxidoreductase
VKGFCPSFVTVAAARQGPPSEAEVVKAHARLVADADPAHPLDGPYGILVTGIGGTGVLTVGALLGMAAHLEGKGCTSLDNHRPRAEERRGDEPRAPRAEA